MAEEIRIIRGDTYDIEFYILDEYDAPVLITGVWNVVLESETINKDSVNDPSDFQIETAPYTVGQGVIHLKSTETNPITGACGYIRKTHYKLRLYYDANPAVVKTVSTGDLIFISEL